MGYFIINCGGQEGGGGGNGNGVPIGPSSLIEVVEMVPMAVTESHTIVLEDVE